MTRDDLPAFTAELMVTAELYGAALSEARIAAYFDAVSDRQLGPVRTALRAARQTRRFFPLPGDLRELLDGDTEAEAAHAFGVVMQNLGEHVEPEALELWRSNPALRKVVAQMGGLGALKARTFGGSLWRVFLKLYQAEIAEGVMRQAALPSAVTPALEAPRNGSTPTPIGSVLSRMQEASPR